MALFLNIGATSEPSWQVVNVSYNATAVPIAAGAGTTIWTPPFPCIVRAFTFNDDSADPLVGGGGATTLSVGIENGTLTIIAVATAFASFTTSLVGTGFNGPSTSGGTNGTADVPLAPAGSIPGRAAVARTLRGFANAGTITGTLKFRFEMRPFAGAWA